MVLRKRAEKTAGQIIWLGFFVNPMIAFAVAWCIRFKSGLFLVLDYQPFDEYLIPIIVVASLWAIVFWARGLNRPDLSISWWRELNRISWSSALAMILPMALAFTYRGYFYSRLVMAIGTVLTTVFCLLYKEAAKAVLRKLVLKKVGAARKLIVGCGEFAQGIINEIRKDPLASAGIVGMVSIPGERCTADLNYLGDISDIRELLIEKGFDEVILAHPIPMRIQS